MDYRRFGKTIIARIDRGEEVLTQLKNIALKEEIKLASVRARGATDDFTVGVFKVDEKKYYANHFTGDFEIVSLTGTISTMNGEYYAHLHMSAGDEQGRVFGGAVVLFVWIESVSVPVEAKSFCQQPVGTFKISKTPGVYRFITCAHQLLAVIQSECKAELFCLGG